MSFVKSYRNVIMNHFFSCVHFELFDFDFNLSTSIQKCNKYNIFYKYIRVTVITIRVYVQDRISNSVFYRQQLKGPVFKRKGESIKSPAGFNSTWSLFYIAKLLIYFIISIIQCSFWRLLIFTECLLMKISE